jgi:ankyrin repeat protein
MDPLLHDAIVQGDLHHVKALINAGISPNRGTKDERYGGRFRWRALTLAAKHGHLHILRYLLEEQRRRIYRKNEQASTALGVAIAFKNHACVKYLAPWGYWDSLFKDPHLYVAVRMKTPLRVFQQLIDAGCDLEELGGSCIQRITALAYATHHGLWPHVEALFRAGANAKVRLSPGNPDDVRTAESSILSDRSSAPAALRHLVASAIHETRGRRPPPRRRRRRRTRR